MGNNYNQYFGKDKRKILVLGLQGAGKTTLINYLITEKANYQIQKTKTLNIQDKKYDDLNITFFDLGGDERQRIFWKQQYEGTQGIIFVIDIENYEAQKSTILQQLRKLSKQIDRDVPFSICLNSKQKRSQLLVSKTKSELQKQLLKILQKQQRYKISVIDYDNKNSCKEMMGWFLKQTKPI